MCIVIVIIKVIAIVIY